MDQSLYVLGARPAIYKILSNALCLQAR